MAYENELKKYEDLYKAFEEKQKANAEEQKKKAKQDYAEKLKQAYIGKMQEDRKLDSNLAKAGIKGGTTETANLKLSTNYQNNRNNLNKDEAKTVANIDTQANDNMFQYKQQTDQAKISYQEQREAEERQLAESNKSKQEAADLDLLTAKYGGYYDVSSLNSAYNSASTTQEKAVILARINYLNAHSKGY